MRFEWGRREQNGNDFSEFSDFSPAASPHTFAGGGGSVVEVLTVAAPWPPAAAVRAACLGTVLVSAPDQPKPERHRTAGGAGAGIFAGLAWVLSLAACLEIGWG